MRRLKRTLIYLLAMVLCSGIFMVPVLGAVQEQDGIKVTLTTDKDTYAKGETISAVLSVENTNEEAVQNVTLKNYVPDGYKLAENAEEVKTAAALQPGESISAAVTYVSTENVKDENSSNGEEPKQDNKQNEQQNNQKNDQKQEQKESLKSVGVKSTGQTANAENTKNVKSNPGTGDSSKVEIWIVLGVISGIVILSVIAVRRRKGKKLLSLLLVITLAGTAAGAMPTKAETLENAKMISVSTSLIVGGAPLELKGEVSYQFQEKEDPEKTYTRGEWIHELLAIYGYAAREESAEPSYSDIANSEYKQDIENAVFHGILIAGGEAFQPDDLATREFAAVTAVRSMGYQADEEIQCSDASEVTNPKEAFLAVDLGLLELEDDKFYPTRALNEKEAENILDITERTWDSTTVSGNKDEVVFQDGVIWLEDSTEHSDDGTTLHLPLSEKTENLKKDDIIVIGYSDAYKIVDSRTEGDDVLIQYTTPELDEFLESMDVEGEGYLDFSQFVPITAPEEENQIQTYGLLDQYQKVFGDTTLTMTETGGVELEGTADLGNNWSFNYTVAVDKPEVDYRNHRIENVSVVLTDGLTVTGEIGKDLDGDDKGIVVRDDCLYTEVPLGRIPIAGSNIAAMVVEIDLVLNAAGTITAECSLSGSVGAQILDNQPRPIWDVDISANYGVAGEAKLGPKLEVAAETFHQELLDFSGDGGIRLGGSAIVRSSGDICFDGGFTLYAELNAFEDTVLNKWLKGKLTWEIWNEYNSPLKRKVHLENLKIVPGCSFEDDDPIVVIEGKVANADDTSQYISGATIEAYETDKNDNATKLVATTESDENGDYKLYVKVPFDLWHNIKFWEEGKHYLIRTSAKGYLTDEDIQPLERTDRIYRERLLMAEGEDGTLDTGIIGGTITNSVNGTELSDTILTIYHNRNKTDGEIVETAVTDEFGHYEVELPIGYYTIVMKKGGYITDYFNVTVTRKGNHDWNGTMVPDGNSSIASGDLRIVLLWGEEPSDLDSHLWGPTIDGTGKFHIFYGDKTYYEFDETGESTIPAFLDLDDTTSYGPETTTVYEMNQSGTYSFYVHDFTNRAELDSHALANSGAKVEVYLGTKRIETYHVPASGVGNVWHVFDFDSDNQQLIPVNEFSSESDASMVGAEIASFGAERIISPDKETSDNTENGTENNTENNVENIAESNVENEESVEEEESVEDDSEEIPEVRPVVIE